MYRRVAGMFEEFLSLQKLLEDYPELEFYPSGYTAKLQLSPTVEVIIDPQKDCKEWIAVDLFKGVISPAIQSTISTEERLL
ncbi:MAG: hypothetical protein QUS12_11625, partial [Methanosarcina sp.]|nr:hypothetical protein [Methanosarcina sp.]